MDTESESFKLIDENLNITDDCKLSQTSEGSDNTNFTTDTFEIKSPDIEENNMVLSRTNSPVPVSLNIPLEKFPLQTFINRTSEPILNPVIQDVLRNPLKYRLNIPQVNNIKVYEPLTIKRKIANDELEYMKFKVTLLSIANIGLSIILLTKGLF